MMTEVAGYLLLPALPEIFLACASMVLLMIGAYSGPKAARTILGLAILMLVCTGAIICWLPPGRVETFGGSFVLDDFARFLKILSLTGSAVTLLLSIEFLEHEARKIFEYAILVMLSTVGMLVLISAND